MGLLKTLSFSAVIDSTVLHDVAVSCPAHLMERHYINIATKENYKNGLGETRKELMFPVATTCTSLDRPTSQLRTTAVLWRG